MFLKFTLWFLHWLNSCSVACFFREGNGIPLQYSCLENPMDGGARWAVVHGVAKSRTWLSDFPFTFHFHALGREMATHSSVFAWRIPGTGEPGGLPSMGSHRVRHDWSDLAAASAYLRLLIFLPAILIPTCASSSPTFHMMYSAYRTSFPIWNQSVVPCPVLTVACWSAYRFLRRQVRWSGITISLRIIHSCDLHSQRL